jgi:predicted acyltransferase
MSEGISGDRLISLDVFRGLTIAGMVLVNNPGTWSHIYDPLEHAAWHGLTPTDWIFPFFLFIVGVAIPIALGKHKGGNPTVREGAQRFWPHKKIFTRSAIIFLLGLAISVTPFFQFQASDAPDSLKMLVWLSMTAGLFFLLLRSFKFAALCIGLSIAGIVALNLGGYNLVTYNFATMRIPGVLQRIAVCYLIASLIFLHTNWRQQLGIAVALLLGYWALMTLVPVPGCAVTTFNDKACNLAAWLDRTILTEDHMWRSAKVFDPEGILSTLPAIATTISGVLTGTWLRRRDFLSYAAESTGGIVTPERAVDAASTGKVVLSDNSSLVTRHLSLVSGLFFFGTILLAVGYIWSSYFPLNKSLWTSSYVLVTNGLALLVLGCCYWLIDLKGYKGWAWPFVVFGVNALPLFVFSGIMARMLGAMRVAGPDDKPVSLQKWIFDNIYLSIAQPVDASLMFAISFILLWLFLMWLLYRKGIYIKV